MACLPRPDHATEEADRTGLLLHMTSHPDHQCLLHCLHILLSAIGHHGSSFAPSLPTSCLLCPRFSFLRKHQVPKPPEGTVPAPHRECNWAFSSCLCASVLPMEVNPPSVSQRERGICSGEKVPRRFGFLIQWEQLYERQCTCCRWLQVHMHSSR